jgi:maltose O-acetyltransferase
VTILAHDARLVKYIDDKSRTVKVTIGNNVFIGVGSIILPNVTIGDNAIIGAGSVVTHDVLGKTVVAGNPARQVNTLEGFIKKYSTNVNWDK